MKTLFQKFGRKITKGGGFNIMGVVDKDAVQYVARVLFRIVLNKTLVCEFEALL